MKAPKVNTYETFLDVEARKEIGAVNLEEKGTVKAFMLLSWTARNVSTGEESFNEYTPILSQYGRVAAFLSKKGVRTELKIVDCRSVLSEKEFSNSYQYF